MCASWVTWVKGYIKAKCMMIILVYLGHEINI